MTLHKNYIDTILMHFSIRKTIFTSEIKLQLDCYSEYNAVKSDGSMWRQYFCLEKYWKLFECKRAAQQ